jgi:hypothetical protein
MSGINMGAMNRDMGMFADQHSDVDHVGLDRAAYNDSIIPTKPLTGPNL